jgi:NAD(P)-dependent dehydrogenase (short-subunit alcohol dehydrogenase family)
VNQIDLKNRHAVVTGGAQGIGLSVVSRLLKSGASVSIWDHDAAVLETSIRQLEKTGHVTGEVMDISQVSSVSRALDSAIDKHQHIDILVANAGIAGPNHTTWEYPIEEWERVVKAKRAIRTPLPTALQKPASSL